MTLITSATISYASGVYIFSGGGGRLGCVCNDANIDGCFQYTIGWVVRLLQVHISRISLVLLSSSFLTRKKEKRRSKRFYMKRSKKVMKEGVYVYKGVCTIRQRRRKRKRKKRRVWGRTGSGLWDPLAFATHMVDESCVLQGHRFDKKERDHPFRLRLCTCKKIFSCVLILTRYSVHYLHLRIVELDINNNQTSYHRHTKGSFFVLLFEYKGVRSGCGVAWYRLREITNTNTTSTQTHAAHSFGRVDPSSRFSSSSSSVRKNCAVVGQLSFYLLMCQTQKRSTLWRSLVKKQRLSCL